MKNLLTVAAVAEVATGVALLVSPVIVVRLLLGADLAGLVGRDDLAAAGIIIGRVTGIALIALGVGCLPRCTAFCGMLTYNALGTVYFAWLAIGGEWVGPLLWPAVALHAILTALLARAWFQSRTTHTSNNKEQSR